MKKSKLNILIARARDAVKNAGNLIADAHAECTVDNHPARSIIGHLRDLNDALYGLAIYCQHEVEQSAPKPEAKKCFVVPTRERMAQEDIALQAFQQQYCVPKQGVRSAETLAAPAGKEGRVPMTDADRDTEQMLKWRCAKNPNYEWVWDAPPGPPDWQPVVGTLHSLSNGNVAYLFDAGPDKRNLERSAEKRLLEDLGQKTAKQFGTHVKQALRRKRTAQQRKDAAKLKLFVDTGDLYHCWRDPQPNHPSRFYLVVNGATKKNPKGNGYFTIQQARRHQKKMMQEKPGAKVQVSETYLRK